jgi:hypothetical protein
MWIMLVLMSLFSLQTGSPGYMNQRKDMEKGGLKVCNQSLSGFMGYKRFWSGNPSFAHFGGVGLVLEVWFI